MQTAVRWLAEAISKLGYVSTDILKQAEEIQKQQMKNAVLEQINSRSLKKVCEEYFDEYFAETYGSKGSDEIKNAEEMGLYDKIELANPNHSIFTSSQTEISDCIECDYCSKVVKKFMAIDVWMITDDNKNVCYECQIKNHIGYGERNNVDKDEQKGILVELMELDSKDGLYNTSSQTEISDFEIDDAWQEFRTQNPNTIGGFQDQYVSFLYAIKWYREQLKSK